MREVRSEGRKHNVHRQPKVTNAVDDDLTSAAKPPTRASKKLTNTKVFVTKDAVFSLKFSLSLKNMAITDVRE